MTAPLFTIAVVAVAAAVMITSVVANPPGTTNQHHNQHNQPEHPSGTPSHNHTSQPGSPTAAAAKSGKKHPAVPKGSKTHHNDQAKHSHALHQAHGNLKNGKGNGRDVKAIHNAHKSKAQLHAQAAEDAHEPEVKDAHLVEVKHHNREAEKYSSDLADDAEVPADVLAMDHSALEKEYAADAAAHEEAAQAADMENLTEGMKTSSLGGGDADADAAAAAAKQVEPVDDDFEA